MKIQQFFFDRYFFGTKYFAKSLFFRQYFQVRNAHSWRNIVALLSLGFFFHPLLFASAKDEKIPQQRELRLSLMTYNVHNLFDVDKDEGKDDWEFLPKDFPGKKEACEKVVVDHFRKACLESDWTQDKLITKIEQLKTAILGDDQKRPMYLALQEVENENVVGILASALGYQRFIVSHSPDQRGIDVALLFDDYPGVQLVKSAEHELQGKVFSGKPTRNILEVEFLLMGNTSLSLMVNHWPSQSNPTQARVEAAQLVKELVDRGLKSNPNHHFVVMGDFNVLPTDHPHPFREVLLKGKNPLSDMYDVHRSSLRSDELFRLPLGTYFYIPKMEWNLLDHFFVSKNLLDQGSLEVEVGSFRIHTPSFLMKDFQYSNPKDFHFGTIIKNVPISSNHQTADPNQAGYSDHFGVKVDLIWHSI